MERTIDDSAQESPAGETVPKAFDRDEFLAIPHDRRAEASMRASFLLVRGEPADVALRRAQSGMMDDESEREKPVDWEIVSRLVGSWSYPSRDRNGHPREALLDAADLLAGMLEAAKEGEILDFGDVARRLSHAIPTKACLNEAVGIYQFYTGIKSPRQIEEERAAAAAALMVEEEDRDDRLEEDQIPWADEETPDDEVGL